MFSSYLIICNHFPGGPGGKVSAYNVGDLGSIRGLERSLGEGNGSPPTPVFLPGKFHGQRSLVSYCPWGRKESDTTERLHLALTIRLVLGFPSGPDDRVHPPGQETRV